MHFIATTKLYEQMSLEEYTVAQQEYVKTLQPDLGLLISNDVPSKEDLDNLNASQYILTEKGFYYFNSTKLQQLELDDVQLAQLHDFFAQKEPIVRLSDDELQQITAITGHKLPTYDDMSIVERWHTIFNKLRTLAPQCDKALELFQKERLSANANIFNLSLQNCLDYFEHFYFLTATTDPRFQLNAYTKKLLLTAIEDAMTTCETGKSTRFEMVLQLYRTDLNWVTNVLSKHRYQLILAMNDAYNTINHIDTGMHPHTLKILIQLAASENLGIKIEHYVKDIFAGYLSYASISDYFKKHYPKVFLVGYEDLVVDTLSQHLLFELNELYNEESAWETAGIKIAPEDFAAFDDFLTKRLRLVDVNISEKLGDLQEDGSFHLKTKQECLLALRDFVKQKLLNEGYGVTPDLFTAENEDALEKMALKIKKGANVDVLISLNEAFLNYGDNDGNHVAQLMTENTDTLLIYPDILLYHTEAHLELLALLPATLKNNTYFVALVVENIAAQLLTSYEESNHDRVDQLTKILFTLTKSSEDYLQQLPSSLLHRPEFAKKLVEQNGLLLKILPESMRNNEEIVCAAIQQAPLALCLAPDLFKSQKKYVQLAFQGLQIDLPAAHYLTYKYFLDTVAMPYESPLDAMLFDLVCPLDEHYQYPEGAEIVINIQKATAINTLLKTEKISTRALARLSQMITPSDLIVIINERKQKEMPQLPYCSDTSMIEKFFQSLKDVNIDDWKNGFFHVKKQACELVRASIGSDALSSNCVTNFLAKSDTWFIAMLQHERAAYGAFSDWRQFWYQLKQVMQPIGNILWSLTKIAVIIVVALPAAYYALQFSLFLRLLIPDYLAYGIAFFSLLGPSVAPSFNNRLLTWVVDVLCSIIYIAFGSYAGIAAFALGEIFSEMFILGEQLRDLTLSTMRLISRLFKGMLPDSGLNQAMGAQADVRTKCEESIARLRIIETPSAQEKAEVLETIWDKINADIDTAVATHQIDPTDVDKTLAQQLSKPQTFSFHGQEHCLSFYEVAKVSRGTYDFKMPAETSHSRHSFFNTATTKLLPLEQEPLALAVS